MKLIIGVQRILIVITFVIGLVFMLSETPINASVADQAFLTFGGAIIILLSIGWGWLASKEEGYFTHEAR